MFSTRLRRSRQFSRQRITALATAAVATLSLAGVIASPRASVAGADASTGSGGLFVPVQGRILDTRPGSQIGPYSTPLPANTWRTVQITGQLGVPSSGVAAVAVNFTVVNPPSDGYLKADKNETTPNDTVSYMHWVAGQAQSNSGVVAIGTGGKIQVMATTTADLLVDVQGYYTAGDPAAGGYVPVTQARLVDTRNGTGLPHARITSGSTNTIQVTGLANVPSDASAVMLNFLVATPTNSGHINPYPADEGQPQQWLNFGNGGSDATSMAVGLSSTGTPLGAFKITTFVNNGGTIDLVVDVLGYFTATAGLTGGFVPAATRVYDSRNATPNDTLVGGADRQIQVTGMAGVPSSGLAAVLVNIIVLDPNGTNGGWTRAWPDGSAEPIPSMAVQYKSGATSSNALPIALGSDGAFRVRNAGTDTVNIVIDVEGWYWQPIHAPADSTLCVVPADDTCVNDGTALSLTPQLQAMTTDPSGQVLRYDFEVWGIDGENQPTTEITSGSASNVASGSTGSWTVGDGALNANTRVEYRVRAYNGATYSNWSSWFIFTTAPVGPGIVDISSLTYGENRWTPAGAGQFDLSVSSDDVDPASQITVQIDSGTPATQGGASASFSLAQPALGWHVAHATATDSSGLSSTYDYEFGVGSAPSPPSVVNVTTGLGSVSLTWSGASPNGAPITGYYFKLNDVTLGSAPADLGSCETCTSLVVSGLSADHYTVEVAAISDAGMGGLTYSPNFAPAGLTPVTCGSTAGCETISSTRALHPAYMEDVTVFEDGSELRVRSDTGDVATTPAGDGSTGLAAESVDQQTASGDFDTPDGFKLYFSAWTNDWIVKMRTRHQRLVLCDSNGDCDYKHPLGRVDIWWKQTISASGSLTVSRWRIDYVIEPVYGPDYGADMEFWCGVNIPDGNDQTCDRYNEGALHHEKITPFGGYQSSSIAFSDNYSIYFGSCCNNGRARFPMVEFEISWAGYSGHTDARYRGCDTWQRKYRWRYIYDDGHCLSGTGN